MVTGLDELIDYLLSEIALCGTQGTWGHSSNPSLTILFYTNFGEHVLQCEHVSREGMAIDR
jgi:hypothetical protein